jgi:hypothetical protein
LSFVLFFLPHLVHVPLKLVDLIIHNMQGVDRNMQRKFTR